MKRMKKLIFFDSALVALCAMAYFGSVLAGLGTQKAVLISILVLLVITWTCIIVGGRRVTFLAISITLRVVFVALFAPVIAISVASSVIFVSIVGMIVEVTKDLGLRFVAEEIKIDNRIVSLVLCTEVLLFSGIILSGSMFL